MSPETDIHLLLRAFAEELARCGMRDACTSPGSRNSPLLLALAAEPGLRCHSHVDERAAGFFALGLAKASGLPVAVSCTSGTAAAELLPAAIEAREARVPLLLLTADRPAELRESGAGQAIDQLKMFGGAVKWFFEVAPEGACPPRPRWIRTLACRAYWMALEGRPGVVHLNFPLREPLVTERELPDDDTARADGRPYVVRVPSRGVSTAAVLELLGGARRGLLVAGRDERPEAIAIPAAALAEAYGWPLLADPMSGARRGAAAVAHYDALLRDAGFAEAHRPELVLRLGDLPVSKPLREWLAALDGVPQLAIDPEFAWQDPAAVLSHSLAVDPAVALAELAGISDRRSPEEGWLGSWSSADRLAAQAIEGAIGGDELSEPTVAAELGVLLPAEATLFVASSMPVRDIETFWPVRDDPPRVLCNRGANGIDGTVSSAFGAAAAGEGPVVLLIGDVALAHDIGGLLAASRLGHKLTIVLLDNGGGGIFDFLPIATAPAEVYSEHVSTPTGLDFARAAALYDLQHELAADVNGFRAALERAIASERTAIVEVRTDRAANVALHRHVWEAVSLGLSPPAAAAGPPA